MATPPPLPRPRALSAPCPCASPVKLTVTATMMITMPRMMKVMLSSRARRPSLRAPSMSPCCTLLRDCGERAEKPQEACPSVTGRWKPYSGLVNFQIHPTLHATHSAGHKTWASCADLPPRGLLDKEPSNTRCFFSG